MRQECLSDSSFFHLLTPFLRQLVRGSCQLASHANLSHSDNSPLAKRVHSRCRPWHRRIAPMEWRRRSVVSKCSWRRPGLLGPAPGSTTVLAEYNIRSGVNRDGCAVQPAHLWLVDYSVFAYSSVRSFMKNYPGGAKDDLPVCVLTGRSFSFACRPACQGPECSGG